MDAYLVSRWTELCQQLAPAFTAPTLVTFLHIVTGWVLCRSRPTVTDLVRTVGPTLLGHAAKHWSAYEKFFYRAAWSLPELSRLLLGRVVVAVIDRCAAPAPAGEAPGGGPADVWLNVDDTTAGRHGRHVAWAGYFKDASASNAAGTVVRWAHNWVVGAVAVRPARWPDWVVCLPVLFDLYRKRGDCDAAAGRPFLTRQQIGARMIHRASEALPGRKLRVGADGQYATREMADAARADGADLVSRMRADAAIYALPPKCRRPRRGRPPKKGKRLPTPPADRRPPHEGVAHRRGAGLREAGEAPGAGGRLPVVARGRGQAGEAADRP